MQDLVLECEALREDMLRVTAPKPFLSWSKDSTVSQVAYEQLRTENLLLRAQVVFGLSKIMVPFPQLYYLV